MTADHRSLLAVADQEADAARAATLRSVVLRQVAEAAAAGEPWAPEVLRCANEEIEFGGDGGPFAASADQKSLLSKVDPKLLRSLRRKQKRAARSGEAGSHRPDEVVCLPM